MTQYASKFIRQPKGLSVEEARAAMLAAGEQPKQMLDPAKVKAEVAARAAARGEGGNVPLNRVAAAGAAAIEETLVNDLPPVPAVLPGATVVPARVPTPQKNEPLRIETKNFVAEIRKEEKGWVAELNYKNGAGTEKRFGATKDDLMVKLLEDKGHATVKVRDVVRRQKLGDKHDTQQTMLKLVMDYAELNQEEYFALPEKSRLSIEGTCAVQQALEFRELHPEFYGNDENSQALLDYLKAKEPAWPVTVHNLELAFADLAENNQLDVAPTEEVEVPVTVPVVAPRTEDSVPVVAAPVAAAPATEVRKRGTSGLTPRHSSNEVSEIDAAAATVESREPSVAELRAKPFSELQRIARSSFHRGRQA